MFKSILFTQLLYELSYYFIIYSILGWLMESTLNTIRHKTFINRGFLTGFYCPIYGVGICLIYLSCFPFRSNILLVFIVGMLVATTLEYITGVLMEKLFHASWWDYSQYKFNLDGKICLQIALAWGLLSVIFICYIQPIFTHMVRLIPQSIGHTFLYCFACLFSIDLICSLYSASKLSARIPSFLLLRSELVSLLEQSKLYETAEELKKRMELRKANHAFLTLLEKLKVQLSEASDNQVAKLHQATLSLQQKYQEQLNKYSLGEKRLLKAFPSLSLTHFNFKRTKPNPSSSQEKQDKKNY